MVTSAARSAPVCLDAYPYVPDGVVVFDDVVLSLLLSLMLMLLFRQHLRFLVIAIKIGGGVVV